MIILFYDIETTGLNYWEHGIFQIAGFFEQNKPIGKHTSDMFNLKMNPNKRIDKTALTYSGITEKQIHDFLDEKIVFKEFITILKKYNKKILLCGYNNAAFDNHFLKEWFKINDTDINDYFYSNSIDVMVLASEYLKNVRDKMKSFSLLSVTKYLGINVDESRLHEATYDIEITKQIYDLIKGKSSIPKVWNWNDLTDEEKDKHLCTKIYKPKKSDDEKR